MNKNTVNKITADLKDKYPDAGITSIEVDEKAGKSTFYLEPNSTNKSLAFIDNAVIPNVYSDRASTISRESITRDSTSLLTSKAVHEEDPKILYRRALQYYYTEPIVGSTLNLLSSLACKGFENDIDDPDIKNFYDTWAFDINFEEFLEWVFLDVFRTSHVTTYKTVAKYEPRVSNVSPMAGESPKKATGKMSRKELAAAKKLWSKGHLPVGYTVLNPLLVNIEGSLLFDNVSVKLTPPDELNELLNKPGNELSDAEKELIKVLPSDIKKAAKDGEEFLLDSRLVGSVTYRKAPYERYARPRTARVFDSIEYKESLRRADLSTLDGISNYILKITVGNDEYPITGQGELEAVAKLFNTPSKSFDVVWNHTLEIEKIVSPEIESILGKGKYEQVNEDISGGLAVTRALLDGVGDTNQGEVAWAVRGIREDIEYVRRQVTRWIHNEYRQIAEAMGFDRFPKVRWDDGILRDDILYKNVIAQLVDRRMLSYETALETLGFDFENEKSNLAEEFPAVMDGTFGIIGSPFQKSGGTTQDKQVAPKGTPSNGRPKGQTKKKETETDPNKQQDNKPKKAKSNKLSDIVKGMSDEDFILFKEELAKVRGD